MPGSVSVFAIIGPVSKHGRPGRPLVSKEIRVLIWNMSEANTGWVSPRIVGELRKLGIDVAKSTVEKYRVRSRKPPSPTWKALRIRRQQTILKLFLLLFVPNREVQTELD